MKRLISLTVLLVLCKASSAQQWLPENNGKRKYEDIVTHFRSKLTKAREEERKELNDNKPPKEGRNYHFERWAWYWQSHLDEQGDLAAPYRTFEAWQRAARSRAAAPAFKTTNQSQWTFVGPTSSPGGYKGMGRINNIGFHPTDSNTFIIAAAGGGAWKTTDGGINWTCLTDQLPVLGTSDVDFNPLNPNTIYLCTGDKDASDTYSLGLLKSTDGGITWDTTGLVYRRKDLKLTNELVINPLDTNSLTLATGSGMMKSYDGGQTWTTTTPGDFKEVVYHPTDTNILFAAASSPGNVFRSADGGLTWQVVLSAAGTERASIAVTPADPSIVKAVFSQSGTHGLNGIYHSGDTGKTFIKIFGDPNDCTTNILNGSNYLSPISCDGQGWYDLSIAISPTNADKMFVGGVNTYQSLDGGLSWSIVTQWFGGLPGIVVVHADKHKLAYNPIAPAALYECNDGGIYKSYHENMWTDLSNGLQITQFYRLATSELGNFAVAGAQDNGTKKVDANGTSAELTGGDGMDCQIDYTDPSTFYTSLQYGSFSRTKNGGTNFNNISNNIPGKPTGPWITPLQISYHNPAVLFAGYQHVYYSPDQGDNWSDISPNLSTSNDITRLSLSPQNSDHIFALQGSVIRYTRDFGTNWLPIPFTYPGGVTDLIVDPLDTNRLYATYGGYGPTKVAQYVFGTGWSKMQDSLPDVPMQCIIKDMENGTLYVGTDIGVYYKDTASTHWKPFNTGLPVIEVTDLSINYTTNEIWASTYGRGLWKSPRFIVNTGMPNLPLALDVIKVVPNPNRGSFTVITDNEVLKDQAVSARILNLSGQTVRIIETKFDGAGKLQIQAENLIPGTYALEILNKQRLAARTKVIVY